MNLRAPSTAGSSVGVAAMTAPSSALQPSSEQQQQQQQKQQQRVFGLQRTLNYTHYASRQPVLSQRYMSNK
jgi:hypothetical protein